MPNKQTEATGNDAHPLQDNYSQINLSGNLALRHRQFVMNVSLVSAILVLTGATSSFYYIVTNSASANPLSFAILTATAIAFGVSWYLAKKNQVRVAGTIMLAGMLIVSSQSIFSGTLTFISLLSFLSVAMGGLIILGPLAAYGFTALGSVIFILSAAIGRFKPFSSSPNDQPPLGVTDVLYPIVVMFVVVWLASYLSKSFNQVNSQLNNQASKLQEALAEIEKKRAVGEDVSRQVFSLTAELNAIASQQSSGSQQQATALTQVTAFLEEMTATAQNIASKTDLLSQAAHEIRDVTQRVKAASEGVTRVGENGAVAVEETINGNQRVNKLYTELQEILTDLGQRQTQIKEVVSTIRSISDETHLLSLNAAIEAAGAGEQGQRFAVVAGEVKALADRAVRASRQVNDILGQVEQRIQLAASTAESGHKEIQNALEAAQQSGDVLRELVVAIYQTGDEVEQIGEATIVMSEQSKEISAATKQQYNASTQALETLQSIGSVASQNASGSAEVTRSTRNLEELSHSLVATLVTR
jgi:methyl-accepting chemotaxis protein